MAGYAGTPQVKKLGIKPGHILVIDDADPDWELDGTPVQPVGSSEAVPSGRSAGSAPGADVVLTFVREAAILDGRLDTFAPLIFPSGALWIAWPRKAAGHVSDMNENLIRNLALARGLVDVKVAAIDND